MFSTTRSDMAAGDSHSVHSDDSSNEQGVARQRLRRQLSLLSKGWAGDEIKFKNCDPSKAVVLHNLAMELGLGYNHDIPDFTRTFTGQYAQAAQSGAVTHDQSLKRRLSRTERISDSISKHVSTLKTSIAKGGRRGPLTENGRRDMRALEGAGGACWRCKVLRRKCDLGSPYMKAVLEGSMYKLSITDPALNSSFCAFVEAGRYRDRDSLHRSWSPGGKTVTYTELIATIAWELAENQALLPLLEIKCWENFMGMLETACVYESEVGQTSLVILSMVCLRHCLEALRLLSAGLLTPGAHGDCGGGHCQVECIRNLSSHLATYIDELSSVIFNKENMRDRRWWLSTFYSLFIQSYVRHALVAIEKQLRFRSPDDVPLEDLTATQYLHLPAVLFMAASAKYDPLIDGRLQYALTENSVVTETSVPELHHASARVACEVDKWPEFGIRTPYQFLRRLLQIGSLDFSMPSPDAAGARSPMGFGTPSSVRGQIGSPIFSSPGSADSPFAPPRPHYLGRSKRDSLDSRYSAEPSTIFSNQSSDSLARTMSTDMTSLYESSIFTGVPFSDSVADLNNRMSIDVGTINPIALLSAKNNGSMHEELANHEYEKPHPCTQCKKRFKSPTEAERHINAIHLKSDFWSCKALEDPMLAFHARTYHGAMWDVCGFCGGEFPRRGADGGANRVEMVTHVQTTHRIGECDHGKKFYRADNFRQHLKNTHVALPGKWLKVLEGAYSNRSSDVQQDSVSNEATI
ncbi:hypothetical protein N0V88_006575 [Collariella sp. IMI 366227]|nr:hypothetical protein N0V88_006575 [Collariella sp. IMI 366227]